MTTPEPRLPAGDRPVALLARAAAASAATPADVARLRAGMASRTVHHRRVRFGQIGAVAAVAAAALLTLRATVTTPATAPAAPQPIAASFDGPSPGPVEAAPGVRLDLDGTGELSGTDQAPRLAWSAGRVEVEVEPGAGIDLRVQTREGEVRVVGTVFSVERSPLGTTVGVSRGKVEVACVGQPARFLTADQTATCWPDSAGGLLGRARSLRSSGADHDVILATVDAGLAVEGARGPIRDELAVLRIVELEATGRTAVALEDARAYLAGGTRLRRADVARLGAGLLDLASTCEEASVVLSAVRESGTIPPHLEPLDARCSATR